MRIHFHAAPAFPCPSSRGALSLRFHGFDFVWAFVSPALAIYLSDAHILNVGASSGEKSLLLYFLFAFLASAVALLIFRVHDGVERYFSVHDALAVCKAGITSELAACVILFGVTRLEGIPRSMPIIHTSIFVAGLVLARILSRVSTTDTRPRQQGNTQRERIVILGANHFSSLYIKFLQMAPTPSQDVVALLDSRKEMLGRAIEGIRVVGTPGQLDSLIAEYAVHGIEIDRVLVAGEPSAFSPAELEEITRICEKRQILLDFLAQLLGLRDVHCAKSSIAFLAGNDEAPSLYFRWRRGVDFLAALSMLIILSPIMLAVSLCVLVDIGMPVLFWQQRLGMRGANFLLYKFRTLRTPFDRRGNPVPPDQRLSKIGRILRSTSLDELPQLLNVLVGDMSLIGPRPLLPEDQPANPTIRLLVRPGITGWAQVNGGKLLNVSEKNKLDEWYVRNASLRVDFQVALKTVQVLLSRARSVESSADLREIASRKMGATDKRTAA